MELETQQAVTITAKKEKVKVSTIIGGIIILAVSIGIAVLICMPQTLQQIMMVKGEVMKGILLGLMSLPIFLFVTIKGGKIWYKKWWTWTAIGIVVIALSVVGVVAGGGAGSSGSAGNMNPGMGESMNPEMGVYPMP
ncbi:MAG: hypothetical protein ACRCWY_11840 [Cellulosilyticaceae bacterium]